RTDDKGERDCAVDVDAHQLCRALVLRDREHRASHRGLFDKDVEREHYYERSSPNDKRNQRYLDLTELKAAKLNEALQEFSVGFEYEQSDILQQIGHAYRGDQHRQR